MMLIAGGIILLGIIAYLIKSKYQKNLLLENKESLATGVEEND
jgi:hypothetical protein